MKYSILGLLITNPVNSLKLRNQKHFWDNQFEQLGVRFINDDVQNEELHTNMINKVAEEDTFNHIDPIFA